MGTLGSGSPCGPRIDWLVETLTTASMSSSASGATDCGPLLCAAAGPTAIMAVTKTTSSAPTAITDPDAEPLRDESPCMSLISCRLPATCRRGLRGSQVDGKARPLSTRVRFALNRE